MAFLLAVLTSVFYGVFDFAGGMATRRGPVLAVAAWANAAGLGLALCMAAVHHLAVGATLTLADFSWGLISGVAGVAGVVFYFLGLARGRMAVVAPVSAVTLALVPFLFGVVLGERHSLVSWLGVLVAMPALWLTVQERSRVGRPAMALFGLAAGLTFSVFFIGVAQISSEAGLWPLVSIKLGGLGSVAVLIALRRVPLALSPEARALALVAGGAVLANLTYLLAVQIGPFGLVAVASSFYPVVVAVLARIVDKQRISPHRMMGLALSVVALTLIVL